MYWWSAFWISITEQLQYVFVCLCVYYVTEVTIAVALMPYLEDSLPLFS